MGSTFSSRDRRTLVKLAGWGVTGLRRPGREPYMSPAQTLAAASGTQTDESLRPSAYTQARNGTLLPLR